jgi:hypothetical protein
MTEIRVGDTIYSFDRGGRRTHSAVITGETRVSWLIGKQKVRKSNMVEYSGYGKDMGDRQWFTKEGFDDTAWIKDNRHKIQEAVGRCTNIGVLIGIKDLLERAGLKF